MTEHDDLDTVRQLITMHRSNIRVLRQQVAQIGQHAADLKLLNSIAHEQAEIRKLKLISRSHGQIIADMPFDEEPIQHALSLADDSQVIHNGFDALRSLVHRSDVREMIGAYRGVFAAVCAQIALITVYKRIHDYFQDLELSYNIVHTVLSVYGDQLALDQQIWEVLKRSEPQLRASIRTLLDYVCDQEKLVQRGVWQQQLERAGVELQSAVDTTNGTLLKRATNTIQAIIDRQTSQVNNRMHGAAESLAHQHPEEALHSIRDQIAALHLAPHELTRLRQFEQGIVAMGRISINFFRMVTIHHDFQEIDDTLRLLNRSIEQDVADLQRLWDDLYGITSRICQQQQGRWSNDLRHASDAFHYAFVHYLTLSPTHHQHHTLVRGFRAYQTHAGNSFRHVDDDLLDLCSTLTQAGEALTRAMEGMS